MSSQPEKRLGRLYRDLESKHLVHFNHVAKGDPRIKAFVLRVIKSWETMNGEGGMSGKGA